MPDATSEAVHVAARRFRNAAEFDRWRAIRTAGFGEWYVGPPVARRAWLQRQSANARARLFPEFLREARTAEGLPVGYVATVPGYWNGCPQGLHDLHHYDVTLSLSPARDRAVALLHWTVVECLAAPRLFDAALARFRQRRIAGANAIVLVAMTIDPAHRGRRIPTAFLDDVRVTAARLGFAHVIAPFRPNAYGEYKAARRATHDPALFDEYCALRNDDGLPVDPWLRVLARHGARFVRTEPRSCSVYGPVETFDAYRSRHRPEAWYSPVPDVWECGETPTWYVDRCRRTVRSIEPNIWGVLPADH
jgi:hypothetical protein